MKNNANYITSDRSTSKSKPTFFSPINTRIQKKCADCEKEERVQRMELEDQEDTLQAKHLIQKMGRDDENTLHTKPLMMKSEGDSGVATSSLSSQLNSSKGGGSPLTASTNQFMSKAFSKDFSNVRVHTGSNAVQMNKGLNARAFTHGSDIYFNKGQYSPDTSAGKRLLGHELTHVVQQQGINHKRETIQRASLISDGQYFMIVNNDGPPFYFYQLVNAIQIRYRLDPFANREIANWVARKNNLFQGTRRMNLTSNLRIIMPRLVAMFQVDWVEPFNPFSANTSASGDFRILPQAFRKAQQMWERENIFVGFRPGAGINNPAFQSINFNPTNRADRTPNHTVAQEHNLLSDQSTGPRPPGYFRIIVTGSTSEDVGVFGKTIRSRPEERIQRDSEGILLFAQTYANEGLRQTAPQGNTDQELAELIAHEIGHFLFNLSHNQDPVENEAQQSLPATPSPGQHIQFPGSTVHPVEGFMRGDGEDFDPTDRLGPTSRRQVDEAFENSDVIPRPANPTE